jgi:hypothetical protein
VAKAMRPRPRNKDCYRNAFRALVPASEILGAVPWYVEGFATVPHAWLETEDGRVIDVTPTYLERLVTKRSTTRASDTRSKR